MKNQTVKNKFIVCQQTRKLNVDCLYKSLKKLLVFSSPISEITMRDQWLKELRKHKEILSNGWYMPPPHGFIILFGNENNIQRLHLKSARPEEFWPKDNNFLDRKKGIASMYFSPVDKQTGIIGDFGLTIYFGKDKQIISHFQKVFKINQAIFDYIKTEMKFFDIAKFALDLAKKNNLTNDIVSSSDPTSTNIGHTIPAVYEDWTKQELTNVQSSNPQIIANAISKKRKFLSLMEQTTVQPGMAFTIEPRLLDIINPKLPMVYFHTTVLIKENGEKELLTDFDRIFKLVDMYYML